MEFVEDEYDSDDEIFLQLRRDSLASAGPSAATGDTNLNTPSQASATASSSKSTVDPTLDTTVSQYSINKEQPWTNGEIHLLKTVMNKRKHGKKCKSWKNFSIIDWRNLSKETMKKRMGKDMRDTWFILRQNEVSKLNQDSVVKAHNLKTIPFCRKQAKKSNDGPPSQQWSLTEINLLKKTVAEYDAAHPVFGDTEILRDWNLISLDKIKKKSNEVCRAKWRQLEMLAAGKKGSPSSSKATSPKKSPRKRSDDPLRLLPKPPTPPTTAAAKIIPKISLIRKPLNPHKDELEAISRLIHYPDSYDWTWEIGVVREVQQISWEEASAAMTRIIEMNWD